MTASSTVLVRPADAADAAALVRLAALDSARPPRGDVLVAEVDGERVAALELSSGRVVADPFRPTAAVVRVLAEVAASRERPAAAPRRRAALGLALRARAVAAR